MQVLVYDDNPNIAESLANKIQDTCDNTSVTAVQQTTFQDLMGVINHRRAALRPGGQKQNSMEPTDIDEADVVVVDYDLLAYSEAGDTTGSRFAYLLRCFTKCGLIIVLNEYGTNTFDLRLRNPSQDFADLHLGAEQIGNPGLWTSTFEGYRPWHWPVVPSARENFEKCVEDVQENFNEPILDFLGLEPFVDWLPKQAYDLFLGSENMKAAKFSTFVENTRGGIETKDELLREYAIRVAAARIVGLLNGLILSDQSLLVDAPHLLSRFPSLIQDGTQDIHSWNRLCNPLNEKVDDLLVDFLAEYRFKKQHWLWRPVWYWPNIVRDERISEVTDPWTVKDIDWVFCENISRFIPEELAHDFRADVNPPFNKRFILKRESSKAKSIVSKLGSGHTQDPAAVEYVPQAAFSS